MQLDELLDQTMLYHPEAPQPRFPSGGGVYLLTDAADRPVQLAAAADLRRALRARLSVAGQTEQQEPVPQLKRLKLGEVVRRIRWRPAHSAFELTWAYYQTARRLMPGEYMDQVAFGPSWFVYVNPAARIPRFSVSKLLSTSDSGGGTDLGPFATQGEASRFVQVLQDAFDLCRYEHILEQAPHGQACAYFEMGRCPAPCDGSQPMTTYREAVAKAVRFARGERGTVYAEWEGQMRAAAGERAFERAAALKQQLHRARSIEHPSFARTRTRDEFNYLIVQRGGGRTRIKAFFVRQGLITEGPVVPMKDVVRSAPDWIESVRCEKNAQFPPAAGGQLPDRHPPQGVLDRQEQSEHIWLVSHYLFKREPPGLFIHADDLSNADNLSRRIQERFRPVSSQPVAEASQKD